MDKETAFFLMYAPRQILWPFLIAGTLVFVSGQSNIATPNTGFSIDKVAHFLVFGLLATSIVRLPAFYRRGWIGALAAIFLVSAFGGLDECRQSLTPGRMVELADWIADTAGGITATLAYRYWGFYRRCLEWTPRKAWQHP
ncbi:MAG: VanZ family protein, partial [Opitutales bacterium]